MRVVFLTHYFTPEVGAAQARIEALALGLQQQGVDIVVHTGFPHYPAGVIPPPYRNAPMRRETLGGLDVVRSLTYPVPNSGVVRRIANHAVLAISTTLTARASGPADVVVAESPPLFMAAAGIAHAAGKRAACALNVSDLWPRSAVELGALTHPAAVTAAEALERWCYRRADAITAPTLGIVEGVLAVPGTAGKVHHIPPAVDIGRWAGVPDVAPRREAPLRVLYAGTLGMAQGVDLLIEAARRAGPAAVELTLLGDGPDRKRAQELAGPGVHVRGAVPAAAVPAYYAEADVGVVSLRDRAVFRGALPTKLFEILAAGRPVVLSAPRGEASRLLDDAGCGVTVAPEDPQALADAWIALGAQHEEIRRLGDLARATATRYGRAAAVRSWMGLLERLSS